MKIDLQLIQNTSTNFILYDDSNRFYVPNDYISFEEVKNITRIIVTFKANANTVLTENKVVEISTLDNKLGIFDSWVDFDFSTMVYQKDFRIEIPYISIDPLFEIMPEGIWEVQFSINHPTLFNSITASTLHEITFEQTEAYRELLFLHIARNVGEYNPYYNNYMTDKDKFRMQCLYFDANFKALKAQAEVGNFTFILKTLQWLKDFQETNPIALITNTND